MILVKLIQRLLGFCGHEWEWQESQWAQVEGAKEKRRVQVAICKRCKKEKVRQVLLLW